jgi:hypothetical protein
VGIICWASWPALFFVHFFGKLLIPYALVLSGPPVSAAGRQMGPEYPTCVI